jgi:hypothetical protein
LLLRQRKSEFHEGLGAASDKLERMKKKVVMAHYMALFQHLVGGTEETIMSLGHITSHSAKIQTQDILSTKLSIKNGMPSTQ